MKHSIPHSEKRRFARIERNLPITIKGDEFDIVTETKNISANGAYCQIDRYVPLLTKLKIRMVLPAAEKHKPASVDCIGTVVRIEKNTSSIENQYFIALFFNDITQANVAKINRYVKEQQTTT